MEPQYIISYINKKKKRTKTRFCRFPYLSLKGRSSDAGVLFR